MRALILQDNVGEKTVALNEMKMEMLDLPNVVIQVADNVLPGDLIEQS